MRYPLRKTTKIQISDDAVTHKYNVVLQAIPFTE